VLLNQEQIERTINLGIYGTSGTGKTTLGVTAPDPVILLSERQGFESIRDAAARLKKPIPPTFLMQHRDALGQAIAALQKGVGSSGSNGKSAEPLVRLVEQFVPEDKQKQAIADLPYTTPKTVVLDSCTDMMQLVWDHILEQSPQKTAKDGLPETNMRHWGTMKERGNALLRAVRDLPYHSIYLSLLDDRETGEGDEKNRVVQPQMPMRALPGMLAASCNAVGITRVKRLHEKGKDMELQRWVQFAGPDFMLVKPLRPLKDQEEPNVSKWIAKLDKKHTTAEKKQQQQKGAA